VDGWKEGLLGAQRLKTGTEDRNVLQNKVDRQFQETSVMIIKQSEQKKIGSGTMVP
jgi:hypothetical protein